MSDWESGAGARNCFSFKLISNKTHSPGSHPSEEEGSSRIPRVALGRSGKNQSTPECLLLPASRGCQVAILALYGQIILQSLALE